MSYYGTEILTIFQTFSSAQRASLRRKEMSRPFWMLYHKINHKNIDYDIALKVFSMLATHEKHSTDQSLGKVARLNDVNESRFERFFSHYINNGQGSSLDELGSIITIIESNGKCSAFDWTDVFTLFFGDDEYAEDILGKIAMDFFQDSASLVS